MDEGLYENIERKWIYKDSTDLLKQQQTAEMVLFGALLKVKDVYVLICLFTTLA